MTAGESSKERKNKGRWKRWLRDLVLFAVLFGGISLWQGRNLLASGAPAPAVELTDLEGASVQLSDLHGKKVLLYFWAPWCGVCNVVSPNLGWLAKSDGVEVVSIASSYGDVGSVLAAHPEDFSSLALLGGEDAAQAFSVNAYPTFYVLDEEGRIQRSFLGYTTKLGLWLRTRF